MNILYHNSYIKTWWRDIAFATTYVKKIQRFSLSIKSIDCLVATKNISNKSVVFQNKEDGTSFMLH